ILSAGTRSCTRSRARADFWRGTEQVWAGDQPKTAMAIHSADAARPPIGDRMECTLLRCICRLLARSGRIEASSRMSAFRVEADMPRGSEAFRYDANDPKRTWWE